MQKSPTSKAAKPDYTPRARKVLALAEAEAKSMGHQFVGSEHLLLGLVQEGEGVAAKVLTEQKVDIDTLRQAIIEELRPEGGEPDGEMDATALATSHPEAMPSRPFTSKTPQKFPALRAFGRNLNEAARENKLDTVIGRKTEVRRLIDRKS